MKKNTILSSITISELNQSGVGIIRVEWQDRPIEVSGGVLPGMICDVRVIKKTRNKIIGRIIAIHDAGPYATLTPRCSHTVQSQGDEHKVWCGGCKWQTVTYDDQLTLKKKAVEQCIYGEWLACEIQPTLPTPDIRWYRNKVEYSFGNYITGKGPDKRILSHRSMGFNKQGQFGKIVDIDHCDLVDEKVNSVMNHLKTLLRPFPTYDQRRHEWVLRYCMIRQGKGADELMVVLSISRQDDKGSEIITLLESDEFLREQATTMMVIEHDGLGGVIADRDSIWHTLRGNGTIQEILHIDGQSFAFSLSPQSFFQTNTRGCELLYSTVAETISSTFSTWSTSSPLTLYDLYCGTGTIGQIIGSLLPSVQKVIGIDIVPEAIDDARANAERLGVDFETDYHAGPVEAIFPTLVVDEQSIIIVDPPRAGLHQWAVDTLLEIKKFHPQMKLCYVSCNPATLARDLAMLQSVYRIESIQPVDMFPHTHHVETVVRLG